jgi:ribosomal protein L31E
MVQIYSHGKPRRVGACVLNGRTEVLPGERLASLKESNPVEVADYAVAHGLETEPAFAWWVPFTLKRRNRIIAAVNKRYHKRTHKFGIEIPKTYDDCVRIDRENENTLWQDAIRKEMAKVRIAFKTLGDNEVATAYLPRNAMSYGI